MSGMVKLHPRDTLEIKLTVRLRRNGGTPPVEKLVDARRMNHYLQQCLHSEYCELEPVDASIEVNVEGAAERDMGTDPMRGEPAYAVLQQKLAGEEPDDPTLIDFLAVHAPPVPPWFTPTMKEPRPRRPSGIDDTPSVRDEVRRLIAQWDDQQARERFMQWPYAWAMEQIVRRPDSSQFSPAVLARLRGEQHRPMEFNTIKPAGAPRTVADLLASRGVFKGAHGLEGLLNAREFWDRQAYGTRLEYGPGIMDYLHHSVLAAAVELLREMAAKE